MSILADLYDKVLHLAIHRHAERYLAVMSFAESFVFPLPPDVMLVPMALAKPKQAFRYAGIAMFASVFGGVAGYLIGYFTFYPFVLAMLKVFGYAEVYQQVLTWLKTWDFWLICIAGFTPIPYKLFTIGAGVMQLDIFLFMFASVVGRGARFFLISSLIRHGDVRLLCSIRHHIDRIVLCLIISIVIVILVKIFWT